MLKKIEAFLDKFENESPKAHRAAGWILIMLCVLFYVAAMGGIVHYGMESGPKMCSTKEPSICTCTRSVDCFKQWIPIDPDPG